MAIQQNIPPKSGMILVAGANLLEPNFSRSVILLCEHRYDGSFGLVLNRRLPIEVSDIMEHIKNWNAPLYRGGPVQENSLHFVHRCPDLGIGSQEIMPGLFWGGKFEVLNEKLSSKQLSTRDVRFFLGYSGWGEGQLVNEIQRDSWYLHEAGSELVFCNDSRNHWRKHLR